jgi:hypothetical protein
MLLCEIHARRIALRDCSGAARRTAWLETGIRFQGPAKTADEAATPLRLAGLGKACPLPEPFKRARPRQACLIFDLELFDIGGLGLGGFDPFLHSRASP